MVRCCGYYICRAAGERDNSDGTAFWVYNVCAGFGPGTTNTRCIKSDDAPMLGKGVGGWGNRCNC